MKTCRCCKINKLEDEFYKRSTNLDGLYSYCKKCTSKKNKDISEEKKVEYRNQRKKYKDKNKIILRKKSIEYYRENREKQLKNRKEYRKKNLEKISLKEAFKRISDEDRFEKNREKHLKWSKDNRERLNEYQKLWYQKNKEKRKAHVLLNRAVNSGMIMRPKSCSQCNKECKPDGHHEDYNKPLDVIWICRACHARKSPRTVII